MSAPTSGTGADYEQYGYDANGNVISRRLRDGTSIAFSYDALDRLASKDVPGTDNDVAYVYDLLGRLVHADMAWPDNYFSYDALGRRLTESQGLGTMSSQYDAAGRRTRLTWPDGFYVAYDYDAAGDMIAIRENGAASGLGLLAAFAYDDLGRRTLLTRGNGTTTSYAYDNVSRLTELAQNLNGTASDLTLGFSYTPASQIAGNTRSNDAYSFTGHANLNRIDTVNGLNQLTAIGSASVGHDARGNTDLVGISTYGYDAQNRLVSMSQVGLDYDLALFAYDPLGRLFMRVGLGFFNYDGPGLVLESLSGESVSRRFVHGPSGDEPLVWYEGSGTSDRRWLHADERGSIIAASDSNGDLIGTRNRYDEYGVPQGTLTGRFGYAGQVWIPEIAMSYNRARIYNPGLGRFMQADPIGYGAGMNVYAYVANDPVNLADPSGLSGGGGLCTGTRICPSGQNSGLCPSCSGFGPMMGGGGGPGGRGSIDLYKISEWENATKSLLGTWFDIRLGGDWGFAAQAGGAGGRGSLLSPTLRALLGDPEVRRRMADAWVYSMGDESTGEKNEYGFWITPIGNDFRIGEMLQGNGPRIYQARDAWTPGATIFFHIHPFFAGEIRGVTSIGLSQGDFSIARDHRALMIAMARPGRGIRGTFSFFEFDCRRGCGW